MRLVCHRRSLVLLALAALSLAACGGDETPVGGPTTTAPRALEGVFGTVVDTAGAPVARALVRVGDTSATSDAAGAFRLEVAPGTGLVASVRAAGHLPVFLTVDVHSGAASRIDATLMPMAAPVVVDVTEGGEASGSRGSGVAIPAGALVDATGGVVSGEVEVFLTPFDPSNAAEFAAYPGALTAEQTGGEVVQLQTYGVLDVTIMKDGEELQVADGATVTARIPIPAGLADPPATVGLWSFDEERGIWIEEGTATLDADAGVYVAELPHLSPWNADDPMLVTCITGRAVDSDGEPIAGARIRAVGVSIFGANETSAGADGTFCTYAPPSSQVRVTVIHGDGGGTIRELGTGDTTLADGAECGVGCTEMGDVVVTRGEVTVEGADGGTTTVDCGAVGNPLAGTCAAGMSEFFACFRASGECTLTGFGATGGSMEFGNGARIVMNSPDEETFEMEYFGPGGNLCGTGRAVDLENNEFELRTASGGGPWRMVQRDTDRAIVCPDGQEVVISTTEFDAFEACTGGGGTEDQCTFAGGGTALCAGDADCGGGQTCCIVGEYAYCTEPDDCSDIGACTSNADCEGDQVCCEISGIATCNDQATCDMAAGCSSDADCESGTECCDFGGFSMCVPAGVCPS